MAISAYRDNPKSKFAPFVGRWRSKNPNQGIDKQQFGGTTRYPRDGKSIWSRLAKVKGELINRRPGFRSVCAGRCWQIKRRISHGLDGARACKTSIASLIFFHR